MRSGIGVELPAMQIVTEPSSTSAFLLRTVDRFLDRRSNAALTREGNLGPWIMSTTCLYAAVTVYLCATITPHQSHGHGGTEIWIDLTMGKSASSLGEGKSAQSLPRANATSTVAVSHPRNVPDMGKDRSVTTVKSIVHHKTESAAASTSARASLQPAAKTSPSPSLLRAEGSQPSSADGQMRKSNETTPSAASSQTAQTGEVEPALKAESTGAPSESKSPGSTVKQSSALIAMGNIGPYRREVMTKIARKWHPKHIYGSIVLVVTIDHEGKLIDSEVLTSSGNAKADREALNAAKNAEFGPLPDWFKGDHLKFKVELVSVEETG